MSWPIATVLCAVLATVVAWHYIRELAAQRAQWAGLVTSNENCVKELKSTMAAVIKLGASVKRLERVLELEEAQAVARGELDARDG